MAIRVPGQKFRWHRILGKKGGSRNVAVVLSLTAMVDMFTVLVIFLLQNYNATGEILYIPEEVTLPKAAQIKELKPSIVVTISRKELLVDTQSIMSFEDLRTQPDWMVRPLYDKLTAALEVSKKRAQATLAAQVNQVVNRPKAVGAKEGTDLLGSDWSKVTVQADKGVEFLTVKKVMYTVTEAGAGEINFAVVNESKK